MNICFVTDQFTDYVSGVEQSLNNQMELLSRAGHSIFLIRPHQSHQPILTNELTLKPLITLRVGGAVLPVVPRTARSMQHVREFLVENNIDVIHSQGQGPISYATLLVARDLSIPFVDTLHSFFLQAKESFITWLLKPVTVPLVSLIAGYKIIPLPGKGSITNRAALGTILTFLKKVDVVISPSVHQKSALQEAGLMVPIVCIPNPLSLDSEKPALPLPDGVLRIVWVGRMAPEKRLPIFAEAIAIAHRQRPGKLSATIIGDGVDKLRSQELTSAIPGIDYVGVKNHDQVLRYLDESHLLALTSYHFDNQPMVITEAISRHRGVVYCDERLSPEVGDAGLLASGHDAESIAAAIIECIDNPQRIAELSEGCKRQIEVFLPGRFVTQALEVYGNSANK